MFAVHLFHCTCQDILDFHWNGEFVVDKIKEGIGGAFIRGGNSKVINLSFKDDTFAVDGARIEAGFVYHGC